jgi:RNA polymerase sigma-70 factor (ECF subfamily)
MSDRRLSEIDTQWSLIERAHQKNDEIASLAKQEIIDRYGPAIHRYLLGAVRNAEAADGLFQQFALKLVQGEFKNAAEHKGRFRNMIKTSLYHLVCDYSRKMKREKTEATDLDTVEEISLSTTIEPKFAEQERDFLLDWRDIIIQRSWEQLKQQEQSTGLPHYTILRRRVEKPKLSIAKLLYDLEPDLKKVPTMPTFRVTLHRARHRFASSILHEVCQSLNEPTDENIENELIELSLHQYCKPLLER